MKYRNDLKKRILAGLLAGAALCLAAPAAQAANVIPNTQLPTGGQVMAGNVTLPDIVKPGGNPNGATSATITQNSQNAVIKWDSFNIGANATVTFQKGEGYTGSGNFNTLNYDISGSMSQIYGTINAQGGNIYIVNPNGVEIGNSAQINTGSLYVSNKNLDDKIYEGMDIPQDMDAFVRSGQSTDAALMSLGNINANTVTFEGSRIVIDTERIKDVDGDNKLTADKITIRTNDASNVVIGYDAYNEENKTYAGANNTDAIATVNGTQITKADGYMWVEDVEQLQAINTNLSGNYALRNSIDATATQDWNVVNGTAQGFASIGSVQNAFTGKFDGLDYNIFNLNINRGTEDNVGLFGVVGDNAVINNVTLVGGSITGGANVGALAGSVQGGAHISNITNSASVTGASNVGGIVGASVGTDENHTVYDGLINTGTVISSGTDDGKGGTVSNAGGLIGYLEEGELGGASYNLGAVKGQTDESGNMTVGYNVGGLVGHAVDSVIGNKDTIDEGGQTVQGTTVYNRLNVTGAYNVGGIVGNMEGSTVQNAENSGNVTAEGFANDGRYKGSYTFHTANTADDYSDGKSKTVDVNTANVGGIAGISSSLGNNKSTISDVLNTGNVNSSRQDGNEYYDAGNVGGVVGSAVDTDITNATNRENEIRGAHNVGGIAGYFSGAGVVSNGINDGGDIMATGARYEGKFVTEIIRPFGNSHEEFIIGNMGGIVGYLEGDNVSITNSANRGTVHTYGEYTSANDVPDWAKVANAGGIAGKIDRSQRNTMVGIKNGTEIAAISNSYNTGNVRGYTGVGGIAGLMYNGAIASSHNEGYLSSTRQSPTDTTNIEALNMGGIVGDTTENSNAYAILYDVYNKGQIGDNQYEFFGRHVAGIAGRLTGEIDKAYNTGDIYNGFSVVGGIAGWMTKGSITNSFNTGNITVYNQNQGNNSQVGGIVGATGGSVSLNNVYNLGTLRSFRGDTAKANSLGGIIGQVRGGTATITSAYTMGNLYIDDIDEDGKIGSIYGYIESGSVSKTNTYYIRPDENLNGTFTNLYDETNPTGDRDNSNKAIAFAAKDNAESYQYDEGGNHYSLGFSEQSGGTVNLDPDKDGKDNSWRIYKGTTPILNAFLPNAEDYFSTAEGAMEGIGSIQYGTAYDPLLTIVNAAKDTANLTFNWQDLGINNDAGLAVYGAGLTLNDFMSTGGSGYFGGLIYSDGALNINAHTSGETHDAANTNVTGNVALGSASQIYGSSVTIDADGQVTIYGSVTATGNTQDGTSWDETQKKYTGTIDATDGSISITGGNVDVYGQLTSAKDKESVRVPGINGMAEGWNPAEHGNVADPNAKMSDIGDRFGYTTGASAVNGNISITANDTEDGHVNVYYGNKGEGIVTTGGNLTVTASGDIYMDSDLSIGGDLSLNAGQITNPDGTTSTAEGSEAVLDISNIGQVRANGDKDAALSYLNEFLTHFADENYNITLGGDKTKIAVDMWAGDSFNLQKYDLSDEEKDTLAYKLNQLYINGETGKGKDYTYIWVSTGEQLAGIQDYKDKHQDSNILSYNFALKNDIDASNVRDYNAIGTGSAYTGTFDGRDNRIIGLDTTKTTDGSGQTLANAGIFDTIGADGTVEDLRVYSGTFSGTSNAGAVAGVNNGKISNVTAFGNVVDVNNQTGNDSSYAGGIAGMNSGSIDNASAIGTATQSSKDIAENAKAAAGGIAGLNSGTISNSNANSAVNASAGNATALGGVAGVNTDTGTLNNVDSLGVTTGVYKVQGQNTLYSDNVGGIAGTNSGTVTNVYNESIVSGRDNVGGILGVNTATAAEGEDSPVSNVANASRVTGEANPNAAEDKDKTSDYVGGLVGSNEGSITNGRNNGEITGNNYVGGLVGSNGADSTLTNLVNDSAAAITGDNYVGGIAGSNAGTISAENQTNLINRGSITGQNYVGGVAGENIGTIEYVKSDINLNVRYKDQDAKYFGGVAGINGKATEGGTTINTGTITNATNTADIIAPDADFVGGIVGWNTSAGKLEGMGNSNEGRVEGASHVGGVAGLNDADIDGSQTEEGTVGIFNSGVVIAHKGGAGGIFGENTGAISHAELTNNGIVSGTYSDEAGENGTGGIFGVNSGDVTYSSLKNEIGGQVMGTQNVGGLIGVNSGNITGGRTEADNTDVGYYKYQIYNNGTIKAGTWDDADQDGVVDEGEFTEATTNSQNIAGLFGTNSGEVTAGYNTGAIVADSSTNVGGIAGTNAGTLDQVFNTVITPTGNGSITGSSNVGGIAGTNTGTISNAYNTTTVTGTTNTGSIAGVNDNSISNVYGSENGTLVDNLVGSDTGSISNTYIDKENGFDTDGSKIDKTGGESASTTPWRQYGDNNPILKVFLTTVTYDGTKNNQDLVYNGKDQTLDIDDLIDSGAFGAADDFAAHKNVEGGLIFHDVDGEHQNAGKYTDDFWSVQIGAGKDGNPNNLGYDVQSVKYEIGKATIDVSLDDIFRLYGDSNMYKDADRTQGSNAYEDYWHITVGNADDFDQDALNTALESIRTEITDDGKGTNGRTTADAGDHDWKVKVDISNIASNFQLKDQGEATSYTYEGENQSHVAKADLTIDLNDVNMTYGQKEDAIRGQYGYSASTETGKTLVNGDSLTDVIAGMTYTNTAYNADGTTKDVLADGTYALEKDTVTEGDAYKNYNVTYTNGDVTMGKASVVISADDKEMHVGDTIPAFTGKDISSQLVNGDTLSGWYYEPEGTVDSSVGGSHIIGVHFGNGKYAGSDSFDWTTAWDGFKNYNVTFTPGTLTVRDFPDGMPDIPEIPGIENHWNGLLGDNPWDRNRDFRERKAEIHYIAGGMTL